MPFAAISFIALAVPLVLVLPTLAQSCTFSNIPSMVPGVFNASTCIEINAPLSTAWDVLLDFPSYPDWNPFVRSQTVTDAFGIPLDDQTAHENLRAIIDCQIPPLPLPVNASTPPNLLHAQSSFENITVIDENLNRVAWQSIMLPQVVLNATHWQAFTVIEGEDGSAVTLYESLEVYYGPLGYVLDALFAEGLQEAFVAQGVALKARVEGMV